jgi:hypothetical protein
MGQHDSIGRDAVMGTGTFPSAFLGRLNARRSPKSLYTPASARTIRVIVAAKICGQFYSLKTKRTLVITVNNVKNWPRKSSLAKPLSCNFTSQLIAVLIRRLHCLMSTEWLWTT